MNLEFVNKGYYSILVSSPEKNPTILLLSGMNLISAETIKYYILYIQELSERIRRISRVEEKEVMVTTVEEKIGNAIGGLAFTSLLGQDDDLQSSVEKILSLQLLADYGDTLSDTTKLDFKEISDIYSPDSQGKTIDSYLKSHIFDEGFFVDENAYSLFILRWKEFVDYQLASMKDVDHIGYKSELKSLADKILIDRKGVGFIKSDLFGLKPSEYSASKGGTTYFHNLIVNNKIQTKRLRLFDEVNTVFDYLNFVLDHLVDLATDNGYESFKNMKKKKAKKGSLLHKNIINSILLDKLGVSKYESSNSGEFFLALDEYITSTIENVKEKIRDDKYLSKLIKPMVLYFIEPSDIPISLKLKITSML